MESPVTVIVRDQGSRVVWYDVPERVPSTRLRARFSRWLRARRGR